MACCLLALGSNLGDRRAVLGRACEAVSSLPQTQLLARSRWHQTAPVGGPGGQGEFLNGAVVLQTQLAPVEFATQLHAIESQLGRERVIRWDARVIDIDLLLYGNQQIDLPSLTIPHPRMSFRRFVLEPAVEIAGNWLHPATGWTLCQLLAYLQHGARSVEIVADQPAIAAWLASELCRLLGYPGDLKEHAGVKFLNTPACPEQPVIRVAESQLPSEGGGSQTTVEPQSRHPSFVIVVKPPCSESLLAALGVLKRSEEKKNQKNISGNFRKKPEQKTPGPRAVIRADDPELITQEAVAALCSAWPDLSVVTSE